MDDHQTDTSTTLLTKTIIRRMKIDQLKEALCQRGLDTNGKRDVLMHRMLETLDHKDQKKWKNPEMNDAIQTSTQPILQQVQRDGGGGGGKQQQGGVQSLSNHKGEEQHQQTLSMVDPNKIYILQFDGGSRSNPIGCSGVGMVIYDDDNYNNEIWCGSKYLGRGNSNNVAEYMALIEGLKAAHNLGIQQLRAQGDSALIVKQIRGEYQVKKEDLKPLHKQAKDLAQAFKFFEIESIERKANSRADYLANNAMDLKQSNMFE